MSVEAGAGTQGDGGGVTAMTEEQWRRRLEPERFEVLRRAGTEPPWSGEYVHNHADGTYRCAGCGAVLFDSKTKFDSGSGWPSFCKAVSEEVIEESADSSFGMLRTEVKCGRCGAHLGHVFTDGPKPTGLRYCINSAALKFELKEKG